MTREQQEAARKRCEAASAGPWYWVYWTKGGGWNLCSPQHRHPCDFTAISSVYSVGKTADMEFEEHARTDLPAALDEITRIRYAVFDRMQEMCEEHVDGLYHCQRRCSCEHHEWARELLGEDERPCGDDCEYCKRLATRCADCAAGDCDACNVRDHGCLCRCEDCGCGEKPLTPEEQAELRF